MERYHAYILFLQFSILLFKLCFYSSCYHLTCNALVKERSPAPSIHVFFQPSGSQALSHVMNTTDRKGPTPRIPDSVVLWQSSRTALCPVFPDGIVAASWGPHLTTTALEIQYLTERFGKGKLLRGKREMQMQTHSLGRAYGRGALAVPQSGSGKSYHHPSSHDVLHPPTPASFFGICCSWPLFKAFWNKCSIHWILISCVSEFMDTRVLRKSNCINNWIRDVWWYIDKCCEHNIH